VNRQRPAVIRCGAPNRRRLIAVSYGLVCHGLFVAAVGTMIVAMFFGLGRSLGPLQAPWSLIANGLLLLQFPLLHSVLLTRRGRAILCRLAPPEFAADLATTTYVIIASMQVLLLFALWSPSGTIWWRAEGAAFIVISCLYTGAWLLLLKSILDAGIALQTGFLGWRAVLRDARPVYPAMPVTGLFRLCRQPIYVSFALTLWTVPTWTPDQLLLAITLSAYCIIGPLFKEARFRRLFGEEFEAFARHVPYWLPWPRRRSPRISRDLDAARAE
jgi:protein-S-isoprenylcysteine O-methyltransferase Ste14